MVLYLCSIVEEIFNTNIVFALMSSNFISLMAHTEVHVVAEISRSSEGKATECLVHVNFTQGCAFVRANWNQEALTVYLVNDEA